MYRSNYLVSTTLTLCKIVEEENIFDKHNFDIHWKAIIIYSKIINDEDNEITILLNENQWEWASILRNLEMLIVIKKWICFSLYLLENDLNLIFGCLMY